MKLTVAALGDLHVLPDAPAIDHRELIEQVNNEAQVFLLCGDLTHAGLPEEAEILAQALRNCRVPIIAVPGNHDYESDKLEEVRTILRGAGVHFIDEHPFTIAEAVFVGVKGFGGGFAKYLLTSFGEPAMKNFVAEAVGEALRLENLLQRVEPGKKIVVALHYSPIAETIKGEPLELFPFLGSTRLEEVINRFVVNAVFHGHAHYGVLEGKTSARVPVYNCARDVLLQQLPPLLFLKKTI